MTLIDLVLSCLLTYWHCVFKIPAQVPNRIEQLMRNLCDKVLSKVLVKRNKAALGKWLRTFQLERFFCMT